MSLHEERQAIATLLGGHPNVPARIAPPTIVLQAGSPYLEPASVFGTFTARWEALIIQRPSASAKTQDDLDAAVDDAVVRLVNAGYTVVSVSQPFPLVVGTASYPTVEITLTKDIRL